MELRKATERDLGKVAYMIMKWHREIPDEVKFFDGTSQQAEQAAEYLIKLPNYLTMLVEEDGEVVAGYSLNIIHGVFENRKYGQLVCWYVLPQYRGHRFLGIRLLTHAIKTAQELHLDRIEANPWYKDEGTKAVLQRLRFAPACTTYMKRFN